ncbi:MAG: hypothetical protein EBT13_10145 [Rhodobacteraceae bacterium]|nr:hypothetical protein [Paracoccaceae bacterium]
MAKEFAGKLWDIRDGIKSEYPDISTALDIVAQSNQMAITLADMGDNAGGGAPADSTYFLQEILKRGIKDVALGIFWDPVLVTMCQDAGVGARMKIRLGGKICAESGEAVDLDVTVRGIRENMTQMLGDTEMPTGTGVWLDADGVHLVVATIRTQCFSPTTFTDLGIDIDTLKAMIPKSTNHFYQNFARVSPLVIHVGSPGTVTPDMTIIPFTKRDGNYWPKVENPFN